MTWAPDPSGRHDDLEAAETLPDGLSLLIPDDARALDADRDAYFRELAGLAPPAAGQPTPRALGPHALPGSIVTAVLLVVVLVGSVLTVMAPRGARAPTAAPLSTSATQPPGEVGGLLPDVTLTVGSIQVMARKIRPAVLLLLPTDCSDCSKIVGSVLQQVSAQHLQLVLVGPPAQRDQLYEVDRTGALNQAAVALDPAGELVKAYAQNAATAVVVAPDGTVSALESRIEATTVLDPNLFSALQAV